MSDSGILSISIRGGKSYSKDYSDDSEAQIQKLKVFILELKKKKRNHLFYVKSIRYAFRHAPIRLIGSNTFYAAMADASIINAYIRHLIATKKINDIVRLLDLDKPIKDIDGADSICFGDECLIQGGKISIDYCDRGSLSDLIDSIDSNACSLVNMLKMNESQIDKAQKKIIKRMNKYSSKN